MDQIKQKILEILKEHNCSISMLQLMMKYFKATNKHLYLEVNELGYESIPDFLGLLDEVSLEMDKNGKFDVHIKVNEDGKDVHGEDSEGAVGTSDDIPPNYDSFLQDQLMPHSTVIRSYSTVKDDDQPQYHTDFDQMEPDYQNSNSKETQQGYGFENKTNKRARKLKRRPNRYKTSFDGPQNRNRRNNMPDNNAFIPQHYQNYNSLAPFDYRSWTGGQRYYNDVVQSSSSQAFIMSNSDNIPQSVWSTPLVPFQYNQNSNQGSSGRYWSNKMFNKRRGY